MAAGDAALDVEVGRPGEEVLRHIDRDAAVKAESAAIPGSGQSGKGPNRPQPNELAQREDDVEADAPGDLQLASSEPHTTVALLHSSEGCADGLAQVAGDDGEGADGREGVGKDSPALQGEPDGPALESVQNGEGGGGQGGSQDGLELVPGQDREDACGKEGGGHSRLALQERREREGAGGKEGGQDGPAQEEGQDGQGARGKEGGQDGLAQEEGQDRHEAGGKGGEVRGGGEVEELENKAGGREDKGKGECEVEDARERECEGGERTHGGKGEDGDEGLHADESTSQQQLGIPLEPRPKAKQLIVLDVNGLLLDTRHNLSHAHERPARQPDARTANHLVYYRPHWENFVEFCLANFVVAIWSSAKMHNLQALVELLFGSKMDCLLFVWDQKQCTNTGLKHPGNKHKPLFLKELSRIWGPSTESAAEPSAGDATAAPGSSWPHPWAQGTYGAWNTLLLDDSPYKATRNPANTGVFPEPYDAAQEESHRDSMLGIGGAIRKFLEGLVEAPDVRAYVRSNPFGQQADPECPIAKVLSALDAGASVGEKRKGAGTVGADDSQANGHTLHPSKRWKRHQTNTPQLTAATVPRGSLQAQQELATSSAPAVPSTAWGTGAAAEPQPSLVMPSFAASFVGYLPPPPPPRPEAYVPVHGGPFLPPPPRPSPSQAYARDRRWDRDEGRGPLERRAHEPSDSSAWRENPYVWRRETGSRASVQERGMPAAHPFMPPPGWRSFRASHDDHGSMHGRSSWGPQGERFSHWYAREGSDYGRVAEHDQYGQQQRTAGLGSPWLSTQGPHSSIGQRRHEPDHRVSRWSQGRYSDFGYK